MKQILAFSLILLLAACNSDSRVKEESGLVADVPPPVAFEEEEPEIEVNHVAEPVVDKNVVLLVPDSKDKKKYALLKKELTLGKAALAAFLSGNKQRLFKPINAVSSAELNKISKAILDNPIERFISARNLDKAAFARDLNLSALAQGYALLDEFGDNKDRVKFGQVQNKIIFLMEAEAITDTKLIKYKVYEKELGCSMKPKPGGENIKVEVDENGVIKLNGQRMGKAVEEDGIFYMKIDQENMLGGQ